MAKKKRANKTSRSRKRKGVKRKGSRQRNPVSKAQLRWAFATHKPFARKWARRAKGKRLPERKHPRGTSR